MKFYSEETMEFYETLKELEDAEAKKKKEIAEAEAKKNAEKEIVSKEKKSLAKDVEDAEKKLSDAYAHYEAIKKECAEILEKSNKEMLEKLTPAKEAVKAAEKEKYQAVAKFNKKFGPYVTTYSDSKAFDEFNRITSWIDDFYKNLWF